MRHIQSLDQLRPVSDSRDTVVLQTLRLQFQATWSLTWFTGRTRPEIPGVPGLTGNAVSLPSNQDRLSDCLRMPATSGIEFATKACRHDSRTPRLNTAYSAAGFAQALAKRDR